MDPHIANVKSCITKRMKLRKLWAALGGLCSTQYSFFIHSTFSHGSLGLMGFSQTPVLPVSLLCAENITKALEYELVFTYVKKRHDHKFYIAKSLH